MDKAIAGSASVRPRTTAANDAVLGRASAVMATGTAVSRVLGLVRVPLLALAIGATGASTNAFSVANTLPNMLYMLIAGGVLNAVLVPQVVAAMRRPDGGEEYLNRLVTLATVILAAATAVLVAAAPVIIWLASMRAAPDQRMLATAFAFWCLPQVFFYALYTLLGQILNAKRRFGAYMWAPVVNNVVGLAGLGLFMLTFGTVAPSAEAGSWTETQVAVLAGTSTLGVVAQAVVLLIPLRQAGVRLRPRWGFRGMGLRSAGTVAGWTFLALMLNQGTAFVVTNVASSVVSSRAAGYTIWTSAFLVFMLPHSLIAVSVVTALFTRMSAAAARGDLDGVRSDVSAGLRTIGIGTVLAAAGLLALHDVAGTILVGGGDGTGRVLGRVILIVAIGLVPFSATYLLQRGFYALQDARTPFMMQLLSTAVWVSIALASLLLPEEDRVSGVAVGLAVSQWVGTALGLFLLRRRLGGLDGARVLSTHLRLFAAGGTALAAGGVVAAPFDGLLARGLWGSVAVAVIAGTTVVLVYAAVLLMLRVDGVAPILQRLVLRRRR